MMRSVIKINVLGTQVMEEIMTSDDFFPSLVVWRTPAN
jgi:hypothetical protein